MPYAIERGESLSVALPRIVLERIESARQELLDRSQPAAERIHGARKRFKETRAALRLIRFALGDDFASDDAWFRHAAKEFAQLRDSDAVLETIEKLSELAEGYHERRVLRALRRRRQDTGQLESRVSAMAQQLPIAKVRVTLWPPLENRFSTIGHGLRRTYRDGRRALEAARSDPTPAALHEWRKRVKDHWYHAQILRNVRPETMKLYRDQMETLSDALGDRHDLDVLMQRAIDRKLNEFDLRVLHGLVDGRSNELMNTAVILGERVYADRPNDVYDRFESYWMSWAGD